MHHRTLVRLGVVLLCCTAGCVGVVAAADSPGAASPVTPTPTATATAPAPTPSIATPPARPPRALPATTATPAVPSREAEWTGTVERVVDGDTIVVRIPGMGTEDVRLLGVDTPEVHVENTPDEFEGIPPTSAGEDWLRDWGHTASEYARSQLLDEEVRIATDPEADRRGSYGRLLAYVYVDGELFNRALIDQGYARLYDSAFAKRSAFATAEADAQSAATGLWGFETDSDDGGDSDSASGTLEPVVIHADAPGNDHDNLNEEYIVFENTGDAPLDVGGWTVSDEVDHTYRFPSGVTIEPGQRVTLYTGSGTDSDTELYWGSGSAIWNNGGDTIIVSDGSDVVVREAYSEGGRIPAGVDVDDSGAASRDSDDDGRHEDIDGDGDFDTSDVQAMLDDLVTDADVASDPGLFDFTGDGSVGTGDVQALLNELVEG